jgi:quinoprotein glucose dehydrogenase
MKKRIMFMLTLLFFPAIASCEQIVGIATQQGEELILPEGDMVRVDVWIKNLDIPWSLIFLPDGRALVSERPGSIRLITNGKLRVKPYALVDVSSRGEGGLMGLALHPAFPEKPYVYAMHTYRNSTGLFNRVIRLRDKGTEGIFDKVIVDAIPAGRLHNGGRIGFGPNGMLYVSTGETFDAGLAQDLSSLGRKILRVTPAGLVPSDNPFRDSPVFSFGHRNPQGIAWHPETGDLFISEHGPSGEFGHFAHDEINVIQKGGNYGWPKVIGAAGIDGFLDPIVVWKKTTPPSGIAFYTGDLLKHLRSDLFVSTLKSESLIRIRLKKVNRSYTVYRIERWFAGKYGRIRDVAEGPDGALYFLTNNRDGRGTPRPGDDKIYRIVPKEY